MHGVMAEAEADDPSGQAVDAITAEPQTDDAHMVSVTSIAWVQDASTPRGCRHRYFLMILLVKTDCCSEMLAYPARHEGALSNAAS